MRTLHEHDMRIGLSTNASCYQEIPKDLMPDVEYLIISISGFSEETYKNIHGLNFENVIKNIKKFAEHFNNYGAGSKIIMNFHVYQYNIHEIKIACDFCYQNNITFSPHVAYLADESLFIKYLNGTLETSILAQASEEILLGLLKNDAIKSAECFNCPQWNNLVLDESRTGTDRNISSLVSLWIPRCFNGISQNLFWRS